MTPKIISYDVEIKSTSKLWVQKVPEVYTNDSNSVDIQFNLIDCTEAELLNSTAQVLLYMQDGSFFQNMGVDVVRTGTTFSYTLKDNEGNHQGLTETQLVLTIPGTPDDVYASQMYQFKIKNGLGNKVPVETFIQTWETLTTEANVFIAQMETDVQEFDVALENGVLATNIAAKLNNLETTYSPRLLSAEQQLEQNENHDASKFLYKSDKYDLSYINLNNTSQQNNALLIGDSLFGYGKSYIERGANKDVFDAFFTDGLTELTGFTRIQNNQSNELEWGFAGKCLKGTTGALLKHQYGSAVPYNDIAVYYAKSVGGGTFRYRIVGSTTIGAWTTVDTNDTATNLGVLQINNINDGLTPQVQIEVLSGTVYVYAIKTYTAGNTTYMPYFINQGGSALNQWVVNTNLLKQLITTTNPKQIHIWLGTNDSAYDDETTFIANYQNFVNTLKTVISSDCDIIAYLTVPWINNPTANAMQDKYRAKLFEKQVELGYSIFDLRKAWSDVDATWYVDGVHPVDEKARYNFKLISSLIVDDDSKKYLSTSKITATTTGLTLQDGTKLVNESGSKDITFKSDRISFGVDVEIGAPYKGTVNIANGGYFNEAKTKREMLTVGALKMGLVTNATTLADEGTYIEHWAKHETIINGQVSEKVDGKGINAGVLKSIIPYSCTNSLLSIQAKAAGAICYLPEFDTANGGTMAFYDGTNWRSMHDKSIITV